MSKNRIVHCMYAEKFIDPFITFVEKHFDADQHLYLIKRFLKYEVTARSNTKFIDSTISFISELFFYIYYLNNSKKIIIHGLFNPRLVVALLLQPWLLKRAYWIVWGGDLYYHQLKPKCLSAFIYDHIRQIVIRQMANLVTYIYGDYELAKKWYKAKGNYVPCLMYESNIYEERESPNRLENCLNILVGNSANITNNHKQIFAQLSGFRNYNIKIYCPLSYGNPEYAKIIADIGKEIFKEKFVPILDFIEIEKYLELLNKIDIAIFAHNRQQGMGNTISLLGMGKKVYMRNDVVQWKLFEDLGIKVFDLHSLNIDLLSMETKINNQKIVKEFFSKSTLIKQYSKIFE